MAAIGDLLQSRLEPERRPSKRLKDLADIARLLETDLGLRDRVPPQILERLRWEPLLAASIHRTNCLCYL